MKRNAVIFFLLGVLVTTALRPQPAQADEWELWAYYESLATRVADLEAANAIHVTNGDTFNANFLNIQARFASDDRLHQAQGRLTDIISSRLDTGDRADDLHRLRLDRLEARIR